MSYTNRVSLSYFLQGYVWHDFHGGAPWASGDYRSYVNLSKTRSGSANPEWKSSVKAGRSAGTAYSLTASRVDINEPWAYTYAFTRPGNTGVTGDVNGCLSTAYVAPLSLLSSYSKAETAALLQVYRKIDQAANQWKGLNFFAEFGDVVRQFGHPAKALLEYTHKHLNRVESSIRGLRGTRRQRRREAAKVVADSYLEYCFGLAPLLSDAKAAAEALARFEYEGDPTNNPSLRTRAVGRGSEAVISPGSPTNYEVGSTKTVATQQRIDSSEARVQYIVGLSTAARANFGSNKHLLGLLGITVEKIPAAAWEAVPWSWLADYFSNVGDVLGTIGVDTSNVEWIVRTAVMVDTLALTARVDYSLSYNFGVAYSQYLTALPGSVTARYKVTRTTLSRTIPATLGWPSIQWELPFGDDHLGGKLANLVAVLFQRKGTIPRLLGF